MTNRHDTDVMIAELARDAVLKPTTEQLFRALEQTKNELAFARSLMRHTIAAGNLGSWCLDMNSGIIERSTDFDRLFGFETPLPEWTCSTFLAHVVTEDRFSAQDHFEKAFAPGKRCDFECRICRTDGVVRWMRIQGESWPGYHDKVIRVAGLIADITEQVESRSKTEELNQFLKQRIAEIAGNGSRQEASYRCASDDLRNKACRINDQARLLLRGYGTMLGESGTAILSSLVENGQWIVHLVDTISLYTGIARHQLWLQQVDLSRFAEETALELSGSQSMQSIDLMIDKNILAWADAGLMKHAMKSLFSLVWKPETRRIEFTSVSEGGKTRFCFQARRDSPALIDKNELCVALFEQIIRRHGGTVEISQGPEQLLAVTFTLGTRRS